MTETTAAEAPKETPKQASAPVIAQHAATLKALPFSDTRDFDDAKRGFLGTIENARVVNPQGRVVWSLEPYGFLIVIALLMTHTIDFVLRPMMGFVMGLIVSLVG